MEEPLFGHYTEKINFQVYEDGSGRIQFSQTAIRLDPKQLDEFLHLVEALSAYCSRDAEIYYHPNSLAQKSVRKI